MVHETPDHMSAAKKPSLRKGIKSPFGRKSSKKTAKLTATENLFVRGEDSAVASPILEEATDGGSDQKKDNVQSQMNSKSQSTMAKGSSSGKSHKWPFKSRRSEDNGNVHTEAKPNLCDQDNDGEPGSNVENNDSQGADQRNGTNMTEFEGAVDASALGIRPPIETSAIHQFLKSKVGGYVVPLHRQQDMPDKLLHVVEKLQNVCPNGILDGENFQEMKDEHDGSSRDLNGNPQCSSTITTNHQVIANETTDAFPQVNTDRVLQPDLPPRLRNAKPEPLLPPRIPPKPASLRYRTFSSDAGSSVNKINNEMDDDELPPRPPARPKNRTLGKGSLLPWNTVLINSNRATVYETISLEPKEASLSNELAKLPRQPWYWGPLTQAQAEEKLAKLPDGNFLVRDSSDDRYLLSLSFNSHGRTLHTRIEHRHGLFSLNDSDGHTSVVELIACAVKESRNGVYGYMRDALGVQSFPARLTHWVSRFTEVRSLQHLCRFLIREVYPRHHIQRLPLPRKIKEYILENQY